ncbi:MAG TPA: PEP/pyruvate-binding domain-containing protein [Gemmatimonadales bacterium]|nr:PEP/pyruvate-binding domain-containing protein [Gemmatimonadales bacterium]
MVGTPAAAIAMTHGPGNVYQAFQSLMPFRVQDILLVSSLYDAFTLQEDGQLNELILGEFLELSLHHSPGLTHVSSGEEALRLARAERRFNLIITAPRPGRMDAIEFAGEVRASGLDLPVVVLAFDNTERKDLAARADLGSIERLFLWQGNARILVAIVKSVEDRRNVAHDTALVGVPVILVVEDNVRYYSSFLPTIYTELISQSHRLIAEGLNLSHKLVRTRARPKILLATTFEEAWALFDQYRPYLLGLISDVEFPRGGVLSRDAGFDLARMAREAVPDLPILLQSSRPEFAAGAQAIGVPFLRKYSDTLLTDLRRFMIEQFAFGDFVFRTPDGNEVGRARDLQTMERLLRTVPADSLAYHAGRNDFSRWLTSRTEFALAHRLRPRKVSDFPSLEHLRRDLIESIAQLRREQRETLIADFDRQTFDGTGSFFARISGGSLGGKARGLAFLRYLLNYHHVEGRFPGVHIGVPPAVVIATDCFDQFLTRNRLLELALSGTDDAEIERQFLAAPLPREVRADLRRFLEHVRWPLAVRSSSLLEDSQYLPLTGVYQTFMLPNNHRSLKLRLAQLEQAIKRVYASTFSRHAKAYLRATPYRLEEEKMAVILQKVVGVERNGRYYPDVSGVARSHNAYPSPPLRAEDGVAAVALGMGRTVVENERCLTFSPRHPRKILNFSSVEDILANSQREFWALDLHQAEAAGDEEQAMRETRFPLSVAENDGVLGPLCSTYSRDDHAVHDGLSRPGVRLVTFAPILKHGVFPLAELLRELLRLGREGVNREAEIEFAVCLAGAHRERAEFGFLQVRPLVLTPHGDGGALSAVTDDELVCRSPQVMGSGTLNDLYDVVVVDAHRFNRAHSRVVAQEVARCNAALIAEQRPYVLIGVGRWGSTDPWAGIPVAWDEICGARVIVEAGFRDFRVTPSQGSHFFQNLTSFQVGYFTVNADAGEGFVDWEWIRAQPARVELGFVRHLRFRRPLVVKMGGRDGCGVIYKPGSGE